MLPLMTHPVGGEEQPLGQRPATADVDELLPADFVVEGTGVDELSRKVATDVRCAVGVLAAPESE